MANRPAPEVTIDEPMIRQLLMEQCADLAELALRELSRGWDNTNYRLGDELVVRIPHREQAAQLVINEQRWLPSIAERVDLGVPAPVHHGVPSASYPWHWSIAPFFDGDDAAEVTLTNPAATAERLGRFFAQLHVEAPADSPPNPYRGCPLSDRADSFHSRLATLDDVDADSLGALFSAGCAASPATDRVWLHGDLHTRNMVVQGGELTAAIDWGDICAGDRANDLASAYMLVPDHVSIVQEHAGATNADMERATGWAAHFAVMYLAHSDDDPVMASIGRRLLQAIMTVT